MRGYLSADLSSVELTAYKMFRRALLKWSDKELLITIKPATYKRSAAQNRYYWVMVKFIQHWFLDTQGLKLNKDEVHIWIHKHLLEETVKVVDIAGEQIVTLTSKKSSAMSTAEFAEMVDAVITKMAAMDCIIPEPQKKGLNLIEDLIDE